MNGAIRRGLRRAICRLCVIFVTIPFCLVGLLCGHAVAGFASGLYASMTDLADFVGVDVEKADP